MRLNEERRSPAVTDRATSATTTLRLESTCNRCQRCRREIRSPRSIQRQHGPVCWHLRADAAERLPRLDCGCADPWACRCTPAPLTDNQIGGYADAARFIIDTTGLTPLLPEDVLRALYRRGGDDRLLAKKLHAATIGAVV